MDKILQNTLDCINEGIILLNEKLEIIYLNNYMAYLTGVCLQDVINKSIYEVLPNFDKKYFRESIHSVIKNGCKMFFSAAMHKDLIFTDHKLNLKISKVENAHEEVILLEFVDVTSQFFRINQLKDYVNQLHRLNKELKEKEKVIKNLAYYDKLTGVANRTLFYELSEKIIDNAKRNKSMLGLMFIDVNKFKGINDTYGHEIGDKVLIKVADTLTKATRKNDVVARYGGDEFLILLPDIKGLDNYKAIASRIVSAKDKIMNYDGKEISVSLSIGVSLYPNDGQSVDDLIVKADRAMYAAKHNNGEEIFFYRG